MSLIIVEGADGAGKSTLCEKISDEVRRRHPSDKVDVWRRGAPLPGVHAVNEYVTPLYGYRPWTGRHIICDRWHVGEYVYPRVYDRNTSMTPGVYLYTELFLASRGAVVVYVTPPVDVITRNLARRVAEGGPLGETPPLDVVSHHFSAAHKSSMLSTYRVSRAFDAREIACKVVDLAESTAAFSTRLSTYCTYVGSTHPSVLLVGNTRGPTYSDSSAPAFVPYSATSGNFLMEALALYAPMPLNSLGIVNVNDVDDIKPLLTMSNLNIVALGNHAAKHLTKLGATFGVVPHPQWWRRFLHHFSGEYAAAIGRAARECVDLRGNYPRESWIRNMRDEVLISESD